jgi:threonine synthase
LLDAAGAGPATLAPEALDTPREVVADPDLPLEERLEALEDFVDSEIGDTDLLRARNVERQIGLRQLYVKFEGSNPTGTQKDRIAFAQAMDALRRGYDTITAATCGNFGLAVAMAARTVGLRPVLFIPESYHARRVEDMARYGAEIVRASGDYEAAVAASRERAERDELYDANPGGANLTLQLRAYGEIAWEIYDELRDAPALVAVPVSNGTTLAGIYRGFLSLYRRGRTSRIPRMIAGSSYRKNPIVHAFQRGAASCDDLRPERIRQTPVNEPLINWHSIDGDLALDAIRSTGGSAGDASDKALLAAAKMMRDQQGIDALPASMAGLVVLREMVRKEPLPGDRYVVVLTGRRG